MMTTPYQHQLAAFNLSWAKENFALFMEQGTGKSKVAIMTADHLFLTGRIDAVVIVALSGVHTNWIRNEIPTHSDAPVDLHHWVGQSGKAFEKFKEALSLPSDNLKWLAINIDALSSNRVFDMLKKFMMNHRTLMIVDESTAIKNPKALRTKAAINLGKYAKYRRILTGTPVTQSPLDLYSQVGFLDQGLLGFSSFFTFRTRYAILKDMYGAGGRTFKVVAGYKRLDELKAKVDAFSFRVTKDECLDLPPKVYERRYVKLSPEQRRVYNDIKTVFLSEYQGEVVSAPLALTRLMRLQQVVGGFFPVEDGQPTLIDGQNPRIDALLDVVAESPRKVVIWARFVPEIELIADRLRKECGNDSVVCYYGATAHDARAEAVASFQDEAGPVRFFIGNAQTAGYGLTLTAASTVVYYSNSFSLEERLQSEDRAHRIGQTGTVVYVDLEAEDTIDRRIIEALHNKQELANRITGDKIKEWL